MPDVVTPESPITLRSLLAPGIAAVTKYWKPFLLLQSAALLLVVGYYTNSHVNHWCAELSDYKHRGGVIFTGISAAVAGALLPELAKAIMLGDRAITRKRLQNVAFAFVGFAGNGIIVDLQYRGLAVLFGNNAHPLTILAKVVVDQFVCTPAYNIPYWLILYGLRANHFNLPKTLGQISPHWYLSRVLPLLIPAWFFWVPMVLLIYSLPGSVQFCLFCFALAAWSLVMVFVATFETEKIEEGQI